MNAAEALKLSQSHSAEAEQRRRLEVAARNKKAEDERLAKQADEALRLKVYLGSCHEIIATHAKEGLRWAKTIPSTNEEVVVQAAQQLRSDGYVISSRGDTVYTGVDDYFQRYWLELAW